MKQTKEMIDDKTHQFQEQKPLKPKIPRQKLPKFILLRWFSEQDLRSGHEIELIEFLVRLIVSRNTRFSLAELCNTGVRLLEFVPTILSFSAETSDPVYLQPG